MLDFETPVLTEVSLLALDYLLAAFLKAEVLAGTDVHVLTTLLGRFYHNGLRLLLFLRLLLTYFDT